MVAKIAIHFLGLSESFDLLNVMSYSLSKLTLHKKMVASAEIEFPGVNKKKLPSPFCKKEAERKLEWHLSNLNLSRQTAPVSSNHTSISLFSICYKPSSQCITSLFCNPPDFFPYLFNGLYTVGAETSIPRLDLISCKSSPRNRLGDAMR